MGQSTNFMITPRSPPLMITNTSSFKYAIDPHVVRPITEQQLRQLCTLLATHTPIGPITGHIQACTRSIMSSIKYCGLADLSQSENDNGAVPHQIHGIFFDT
jgi:hypothetical protein